MKNKSILMASMLIPFLYIMFYVWNTAAGTVFRDDMYLIKGAVVEKFCDRALTFADLWRPTGGSRILGYNLLLLANTAWCGLNSRLVVLLIPFVLLAAAGLLCKDYHRSLAGLWSPSLISGTYALLMLLLFNLTLWEGLTFDYGIVFVWSVPWFIASFYALENLLVEGRRVSWPLAIIIPSFAVLVFGQSSSFAFGAALAITFVCYVTLNRHKISRGFAFRALACTAVLGLLAFLYLHRIKENDYFPVSQYFEWRTFADIWNVVRFVLATLGASVVGAGTSKPSLSLAAIVTLGFLVALTYVLTLILYFKTRMQDRTYLPLFMIAYALSFVALMTIGRFRYGLLYGMAPRYTCSTIYGIIAIVWIILFVLAKPASTTGPLKTVLAAVMLLIFAGMSWTSVVEWRTMPYRKQNFKRLSEIAMHVDTASDEELAAFEERPALVRDSLRLLRKHHLNVYRTVTRPLVAMKKLSLSSGGACSAYLPPSAGVAQTGYTNLPIIFPQIVGGGGYAIELILLNVGSPASATFKLLGEDSSQPVATEDRNR